MSDNVAITAGVGTTIATDDIGGVQYQRVKIAQGADGSATDVSSAAPLQVSVANTGANGTAIVVDASGTAVPITDNSGSLTVDNGGTFAVQAAQSGTWNVTNVSGTVSLPTGASTAANQTAVQGTTGSAVPSTGVLVQGSDGTNARNISTTSGGVVQVDLSATAANSTAVVVDASGTAVPITDNSGSLTVDNAGTFAVQSTPATSGGVSASFKSIQATATSIKASAGQVYGWYIYNPNSSAAYVQFFDLGSGSVTLGSTAPNYSVGIPAVSGANVFTPHGIEHATAISIAATTTATGSSSPSSSLAINVFYK